MRPAPLRAAVVGAGLMGRWHAHALAHLGARLVAVADVRLERAERLAHEHRAQAFASLDELLARAGAEVVHVCTPLDCHVDHARRALAAGAHVLVEKPLAPDAGATAQLLACARERRRLLQPVHQFVFQDGVQSALRSLPRIAPLAHVEFQAFTAGGSGDPLLADILPHALALLARIAPGALDGARWQTLHPQAGEFHAATALNGFTFAIELSTRARPTQNRLTLAGACGTIHVDLFHGFAVLEGAAVSRTRKALHPFALSARTLLAAGANLGRRALRAEPAYPGLRALIRAFYTATQEHTPPPFTDEEILSVARARDTMLAGLASDD